MKIFIYMLGLVLSSGVFAKDNRDGIAYSIISLNQKIIDFDNSLNLDNSIREQGVDFLYDSLSLANEVFIEKASIGSPSFVDWITTSRKTAGDNPWTRYRSTMIKGESSYVLEGKIGDTLYLGIQVYTLRDGKNVALPEKNVSTDNIKVGDNGTFRIEIGPRAAANGITTDANDYMLIVREYYANGAVRKNAPAELMIKQTDGDFDTPFIASSSDRITRASAFLTSLVESSLDLTSQMSKSKNTSAEVNPRPDLVQALFPTTDNRYDGFYIQLENDKAIKLTGKIPANLKYASITYYNPYYATVDYEKHKTYITKDELELNADGSYEVYITKFDIKDKKNLITTQGYNEGVISIRYLGKEELDFETKVIDVNDIPNKDIKKDDSNGGGGSVPAELLILGAIYMARKSLAS
ncbi:DUF1214 domain-containing protein [Aeromonas veronii]|uniref:DUF1214 domain-containing protein n=1 Tax=Aeromonas veronii TaxID=654 RepID=UPI003D1BD2FC|nr:DUF1214 domain-containing protein [Aeromonas veronii]